MAGISALTAADGGKEKTLDARLTDCGRGGKGSGGCLWAAFEYGGFSRYFGFDPGVQTPRGQSTSARKSAATTKHNLKRRFMLDVVRSKPRMLKSKKTRAVHGKASPYRRFQRNIGNLNA